MRRRRRDPRVWSEFGRANAAGGVVAKQNPDRHKDTPERKEYKKRSQEEYVADAPGRRAMNPFVVCEKCWQKKAADGSDGAGGFTPHGTRFTGWAAWCRACRAAYGKKKRAEKAELEAALTDEEAAASGIRRSD